MSKPRKKNGAGHPPAPDAAPSPGTNAPTTLLEPELVAEIAPAPAITTAIAFVGAIVKTPETPLVRRRALDEHWEPHRKNPAVVLRLDGRYGVARALQPNEREAPWWSPTWRAHARYDEPGWMARVSSDRMTGYAHLDETFATRLEAERRAWALAREIGDTRDWP